MAKMKMVKDKDGKMVPEFAADGKGKMAAGKMVKKKGMAKGMAAGKMVKKGMAKGKQVKKMMAGGKTKKGYSKGKLVGNQAKLDKNKDGKISGEDFKMMSGGGMMKKKGYAAGKMVKKGMANGGKAKSMAKGKAKVRGSGIAKKGVRPAKMRELCVDIIKKAVRFAHQVKRGQNALSIRIPVLTLIWLLLNTVKTLTMQKGLKERRRKSNGRS